ncbi:hypothetical protein F5984_09755 [Rudanella paleaurantiibacter]|uniref:Uncharacterized protein n=1 Tax=Rudanella paleaurantiibacter TaxID=2614655 RepID=A0A7J5U089_9BACT|nr:hypothetical protein [Rudanella paleaurantiibacter]KAB7731089.1 hypothetical protein F5984_09755 [Rudanella paleaurantiibacter]
MNDKLEQVRALVQSGVGIKDAAKTVFGTVSKYYDVVPAPDRAQVRREKLKLDSKPLRQLAFFIRADRHERLLNYAEKTGKSVTYLINQFINSLPVEEE